MVNLRTIILSLIFCLTLGICYADGNDSDTILLIHCDGTDGSTTFTDVSVGGNTHTITAVGNAQVDTDIQKFGTGTLLLDGTGDYLSIPDDTDWDMDAFTIDMWVYIDNADTYHAFFGNSVSISDWMQAFFHHLDNRIEWDIEGENNRWSWNPSASTWYHLAFEREANGDLHIYANGTELTLVVGDGNNTTTLSNTGTIYIGNKSDNSYPLDGNIDEIRISKVARYGGTNFTPPTAPYDTPILTSPIMRIKDD